MTRKRVIALVWSHFKRTHTFLLCRREGLSVHTCICMSVSIVWHLLQKRGGGMKRGQKKMDRKCVFLCGFFRPSDAALDGNATGRGKKREKATDVKRGREGWYRWERKSTSSHTETINKLSPQSISYGLAWIIALCQSRLCVAWE